MFKARTVSGATLLIFCLAMVGPIASLHAMDMKADAPERYVVKTGRLGSGRKSGRSIPILRTHT